MITVRPTVPEDVSTLCLLQKKAFYPLYLRYHDAHNPYLRGEEDISRRLNHPNFAYFTILYDDQIVGGVLYILQGRGVTFDHLEPGEYYLSRIYVDPDFQGRHMGRVAIALCESYFPDAKQFFVDFPQDLEKNRRCYEACGFRDTGERIETDPGVVLALMKKEV